MLASVQFAVHYSLQCVFACIPSLKTAVLCMLLCMHVYCMLRDVDTCMPESESVCAVRASPTLLYGQRAAVLEPLGGRERMSVIKGGL